MRRGLRHSNRRLWFVVVLALLVGACSDGGGVDDAADTADESSTVTEALNELDPALLGDLLSSGFGSLTSVQREAVEGAAQSGTICDLTAGPRARPTVSQIEVEIVSVLDGCLRFDYGVANFRSLVTDLDELASREDVIAASPLLIEFRLDLAQRRQDDADDADEPAGGAPVLRLGPAPSSWAIDVIGAADVLTRPEAPGGEGVAVAIIDSGIDRSRIDVGTTPIERAPNTGIGDYSPTGHGTIAAAIVASPLAEPARAIAPDVRILDVPADLCDRDACGCEPCARMTPSEAIRWSVDNGADIISMSFGYRPAAKPAWWQMLVDSGDVGRALDTIEIALAYAESSGVAMVAAAGNCAGTISVRCATEDQFEVPAGHSGVIAVGALELDDVGTVEPAWYSTRQPYVEIAAPGHFVFSVSDGSKLEKVGTSYSAPVVAAALAVIAGRDGPLGPLPDRLDVARQILSATASDLEPDGRDPISGHGSIDLQAALAAATDYVAGLEDGPSD